MRLIAELQGACSVRKYYMYLGGRFRMLQDHDIAANTVVGSSLQLRVNVEGDDIAQGQSDCLSGRQEGSSLADDLERPAGNESLLAAVLVHRDDGAVSLNCDYLTNEDNLEIHYNLMFEVATVKSPGNDRLKIYVESLEYFTI